MTTRPNKLAVLIPCYNEEVTVAKVVGDFRKNFPDADIYVFDNASTDNTAQIARESGAIVVPSYKKGKGHVVRHMFRVVEADYYLMVDGDDTYPAAAAPKLIEEFLKGGRDIVVGSRLEHFQSNSFRMFHQFGNNLVARLISLLFRAPITDVLSGYRVFSREFVKSIPLLSKGFEIETEMTLQALAKDYVISEVPIEYGERPEGSYSKLNTYTDGFLVIKSIFMIFKDYKPLWFFTTLGLVFALLSAAAGINPILDFVRDKWVYHVPSAILAAGLGTLSMLSFSIGLILDTQAKYHNEHFELWKKNLTRKENTSLNHPVNSLVNNEKDAWENHPPA